MGEYKHELRMRNPRSGKEDAYFFNHSVGEELRCILDFWCPAGFTDFLIDGIPIYVLPAPDQKEAE